MLRPILASSRCALGWLFAAALMTTLAPAPLRAEEPTWEMSAARFERNFLKNMPDHHLMAVEMSRICLQKTQRAELRSLCEQIIRGQEREIGLMRSWLQRWYDMQATPMVDREGRMMIERLSRLDTAEFEKQYMIMMLRHHWQAVAESGRCVDRSFNLHDDLEGLCESIIEEQVDEVRQLRDMLCRLYGNCNVRSDGDLHPAP